jgi:hypothetical protein
VKDKANQILCERRADGISYQSLSTEVRLVVMPGDGAAKTLKTLRERFTKKDGWKHFRNAVIRRKRSGDAARRLWVDLAPEYAITPRKEERGKYLPRMEECLLP